MGVSGASADDDGATSIDAAATTSVEANTVETVDECEESPDPADYVEGSAPQAVRPDFLRLAGGELECLYCGARTTARFAGSREVGRFHDTASSAELGHSTPGSSFSSPARLVAAESETG